ncbi:MAG: efflux RND transporter periplasmic adaptor subunit [Tepidimonas sp.]|uniref:efflux RND transporter periplasmic adaptor subunit n=1 Tax=Tepidimonas sp. TaxID=2002775 RepID=UPI00259DEC39|nr:efflux RND transporter periplasmic adaptor subunit [Tepidimonas sp.]MDM7456456.1 efflux RND transporter periplasmic adaptor subunit [Tepidimonas sp.]
MNIAPLRKAPMALSMSIALLASGCQRADPPGAAATPTVVATASVEPLSAAGMGLSGTVRARVEAPLAFQVGGRIAARRVDAGQTVRAGQVLFELDPSDLEQAVRAAEADTAAAEAALRTAQADLERVRTLAAQGFVSTQATDRAQLAVREATSRRDAAQARLAQIRNGRAYAQLRAPAAGVVTDVTGQPGQVVAAGQPVATLAQAGAREVEVFFPDTVLPPATGQILLPDGRTVALALREAAPMVDALARTRRARYRADGLPPALPLGAVVATQFALPDPLNVSADAGASAVGAWRVPVGALDERAQGPRVWRVRDGKLEAVPVRVLRMDDRHAVVAAPLAAGERVVALGTHLLQPGMTVQERGQ